MGNYGYVDSKGFLSLDDKFDDNFRQIHVYKKINGILPISNLIFPGLIPSSTILQKKKHKLETRVKDVCWICDGWH